MSIASLYNSLPTIEMADTMFQDRDTVFSKLAPLLAMYQHQFGVCLVHAHCTLEEDEAMVAEGNKSRPVRDGPRYPDRWLADGTPYEFSAESTQVPPTELFQHFQEIVGEPTVLGLFYAGGLNEGQGVPPGKKLLEWTEERCNFVKLVDETDLKAHMETGWLPGKINPIVMACVVVCSSDVTTGRHKGAAHVSA